MSDPSDNKRRRRPPTLNIDPPPEQIAAEEMVIGTPTDPAPISSSGSQQRNQPQEQRAAEAMVIDTPTDPVSSSSRNPLLGPKSPPLERIRQWRNSCCVFWAGCSKDLKSAASKDFDSGSSSDFESAWSQLTHETFDVVRLQPRKRPTQLLAAKVRPDEDRPEILKFAPSITHMDSHLIRGTQCFLVAAVKVEKHEDLRSKLGVCVEFLQQKCSLADCTTKCVDCEVCPHLYKCSCKVKYMGTSWCPHIHIMKESTKGLFLNQGLMFIHNNWKSTEMRHLRAFIQGRTKMRPSSNKYEENTWVEEFECMMRSMVYKVKEKQKEKGKEKVPIDCKCAADKKCPLCDACLCKYACTCEDYSRDKQLCQHIHNVAMQKHEDSDKLFTTLAEFGSEYGHSASKDEDPNLRYYMEQEHQMSFYFDLKAITKEEQRKPRPTVWHIKLDQEDPPHIVVQQNAKKDENCYCGKPEATKANSCVRCEICPHHYTCTCDTAIFTVCRHVHAVARLEASRTETNEEKFDYLVKLFAQEQPQEGNFRVPVGPKPLRPASVSSSRPTRQSAASKLSADAARQRTASDSSSRP